MLIRSLRSFLALHRHGTIVAAAEKVHLSQAAVSIQLKNMEDELGIALFVRTRRSLEFTSAGRQLVSLAEKMVSIYEEMKAIKGGGPIGGFLSLGVINSALGGVLPQLLKEMTLKNPGLEVKIMAGISGELVSQVNRGTLDMAIVTEPPQRFPTNLSVHYLYSEPFALLTPAEVPYQDLVRAFKSSTPYIAFERSTWAGQLIDEFLMKRGVMTKPSMELNSLDAIAALVSQGLGISIVPLIRGAAWHASPNLHVVRLPNFERPVSLITRASHEHDALTALVLSSFSTVDWNN
ncbi:LysR family transcriptional regulator [Diaphorobacter ruginosibacter]|jgi:DNA-binding transcriptional LysR family regulator|uniref:LysR family transcriptional regulator n=1 Tax=Diaphorobacter ruginosibacter TaxID=1715720 RepID=A0A7G9RK62_9BURK|nr:LysR family transcriptional regulator [Diaphorobacter ruginosibacter]MDR2334559.1 LysR family transcriptional regulator [Burkholderiaceae bacterium]QNN55987.1 LysR family transcriptional regulator [Diaphorobacter ruginosibacter]